MEIVTNTLGPIEIDESRIINFTRPMAGVEAGGTKYALLDLNPTSPVKLLQSVEAPHICFLAGDPGVLVPDYVVNPTPADLAELSIEDENDAAVLVLLTVLGDASGNTTANLKAPIVVNRKTFKASQVLLGGAEYSVRAPVAIARK